MITSIRHTGIVVRDLIKTVNFYRALGFVDDNKASEQGKFVVYDEKSYPYGGYPKKLCAYLFQSFKLGKGMKII